MKEGKIDERRFERKESTAKNKYREDYEKK